MINETIYLQNHVSAFTVDPHTIRLELEDFYSNKKINDILSKSGSNTRTLEIDFVSHFTNRDFRATNILYRLVPQAIAQHCQHLQSLRLIGSPQQRSVYANADDDEYFDLCSSPAPIIRNEDTLLNTIIDSELFKMALTSLELLFHVDTVPVSLICSRLEYLQVLDIRPNNLSNTDAIVLSSMTNLRCLRICTAAAQSDEGFYTYLEELSPENGLDELWLSIGNSPACEPYGGRMNLVKLTSIKKLQLWNGFCFADEIDWKQFAAMKQLTHLSIENGCEAFLRNVPVMPQVTHFDVKFYGRRQLVPISDLIAFPNVTHLRMNFHMHSEWNQPIDYRRQIDASIVDRPDLNRFLTNALRSMKQLKDFQITSNPNETFILSLAVIRTIIKLPCLVRLHLNNMLWSKDWLELMTNGSEMVRRIEEIRIVSMVKMHLDEFHLIDLVAFLSLAKSLHSFVLKGYGNEIPIHLQNQISELTQKCLVQIV